MMTTQYDWKIFAGTQGDLPPERRYVLLQVEYEQKFGTAPASMVVGYLRFSGGDPEAPYFVIPGLGGDPTHWCDCLGDDFQAPGWPGTLKFPNRKNK